MAYCSDDYDLQKFKKGFERTISRGPDDCRIVDTGNGLLGFRRLSIMGLTPSGMQPFELDGSYVVCNGELYGFEVMREELREKGYAFASDSDCEIILPMYREYGTDMFAMLDAEFACVLYDGQTGEYIAARDPVGIRPLYYGYDEKGMILFASEPKNLVELAQSIMPFPPGHYYKDGKFHRYADPSEVDTVSHDDPETASMMIRDKLIEGVKKRLVSDSKVGFLLSGGLDSSLVCAIAARECDQPIRTYAIGMREDAIDLKYAREVADFIGADHTEVYMTPDEVIATLEALIELLGTYDITTIRASMGMYLVCKAIHETSDIRVILTGEIARVPFGDLDFVKYVMSLDPEIKLNTYGKGKYLLRHAFEGLDYLPEDILWREKAAFSDAVGHSMVDYLKEYAESCYSDEEFESRRAMYGYATPFTKESLLYREIFEKYYPGQAEMVVDFWMPNREWEGCDVDDPSARVLANYGDSGV